MSEESEIFMNPDDRLKHLHNESFSQDIEERRKFAKRSFWLTCVWVGFIMVCTLAQFGLNFFGKGLDSAQFIAILTTTSASVFGFWLLVGRYLFGAGVVKGASSTHPPVANNQPTNGSPDAPTRRRQSPQAVIRSDTGGSPP